MHHEGVIHPFLVGGVGQVQLQESLIDFKLPRTTSNWLLVSYSSILGHLIQHIHNI